MKALEGAGFVHLYGLAPVLNALHANRRDFERPEDRIDLDLLDGEELDHELAQRERRPAAQFSPNLFVLEKEYNNAGSRGRSGNKSRQAQRVKELAAERGLPMAPVDKGVLNTLSGNELWIENKQ